MRDFGWTYVLGDSGIECWSAKSGLGLRLDGDDELAMRFAAWFRGLVPGNTEVTFCDDMYIVHLDVPPGASAEDIARRYSEL
jgi:hypothetical protein